MDDVKPMGAELPIPGVMQRGRRLARTTAVGTWHVAPVMARALVRRRKPGATVAAAMRRTCEDLGATYIKFGQFVASAPAIVGEDVSREFRGCLDKGPAVDFAVVRALVEQDTGRRIEETFRCFERRPIAAASLAVVHDAELMDGRRVAVKVLRPAMRATVAADLGVLAPMARFMTLQGSEGAGAILNYLIGLREQIRQELDLRNEAGAMVRFRRLFERYGLSLLVVPEVHEELSGPNVLTMEFLEGVPIDDLTSIEGLGHDPRPVVRQLMEAWILTGLYEGVFHADIHAGNLLLLGDGRLGMLDWGIVARLDPDTHVLFRRLLEAAIGIDEAWDDITAHLILIQGHAFREGFGLTDEQIGQVVRSLLGPVLSNPVGEVSMATLFGSMDEMIVRATGEPQKRRTLRQRFELYRKTRRAMRAEVASGSGETEFRQANFLAAKQLVYLERYWKMYLPDTPLLGDHEFLKAALRESRLPPVEVVLSSISDTRGALLG